MLHQAMPSNASFDVENSENHSGIELKNTAAENNKLLHSGFHFSKGD